ncbi:DUF4397 domain-containing protein [Marinobacter sediminicola]|uniref:DUF4397 domain-containing protein n=1 Tax=Marinobacter sediminicola TaxID=3072994 RepID=UPI002810AECA|nr:DUF4397 domain-containing protein [Marinobacter sp. F26243]
MKTKVALTMALAGSVMLVGCSNNDNDPVVKEPTSKVRVLHAVSDAPPVNVLVDGQTAVSGADFKQAAVISPAVGSYSLTVEGILPGGATTPVIGPADVTLEEGFNYDVIAVGNLATIEPLILADDGALTDADLVRLRVAHLSPAAQAAVNGPVEVYVSVPDAELSDDGVLSFSFEFKGVQDPIEVPAGDYRIRVAIPGDTPTVVYNSGVVSLVAGSDLLVGAVDNTSPATTEGASNSPISLIAVTSKGEVLELYDENQKAGVRVVHNSADAPAVAVLVDDSVAIPSLTFPNVAPGAAINSYAIIPNGTRNLKVSPATSAVPESAVIDADVEFGQASAKTVVAVNVLAAIEPLVLVDSVRSIATQASLRVVHGAVEAGTVDVYLVPTAEGGATATVLNSEVNDPTLNDFEFKSNTGYLAVPEGEYVVFITDQSGNELLKTGSVTLSNGGVYTAIARLAPEDSDNTAGLTLLDDFAGPV